MRWLEAEKLREIAEGVLNAAEALREAKEAEDEYTDSPTAYAHIEVEADALTRTLVIRTGNHFFGGDRDEVRRGRIGDWALIWERRDIGITTGEDFMPGNLRTWLLEHTRAEEADSGMASAEGHEEWEDAHEHYWDIYPW